MCVCVCMMNFSLAKLSLNWDRWAICWKCSDVGIAYTKSQQIVLTFLKDEQTNQRHKKHEKIIEVRVLRERERDAVYMHCTRLLWVKETCNKHLRYWCCLTKRQHSTSYYKPREPSVSVYSSILSSSEFNFSNMSTFISILFCFTSDAAAVAAAAASFYLLLMMMMMLVNNIRHHCVIFAWLLFFFHFSQTIEEEKNVSTRTKWEEQKTIMKKWRIKSPNWIICVKCLHNGLIKK